MEISIHSQTGPVVEKMTLPKEIFEVPVRKALVHRALIMQQSNERSAIAHTKHRDERAGSTRKLYRQKGTGRARKGDVRSPIMRKGGVAFGPRSARNFELKMNHQERRGALFSMLSAKAKEKSIVGLDKYEGKMNTKAFVAMLAALELSKKVLVVLAAKDPVVQKSASNLPRIQTILVNYLNVRDLLHADHVLFLKDALLKLPTVFKPKK